MSDISEMIRYTKRYNEKVNKFCAPLFRNFGFNSVFYHYISAEGFGTCFGTHVESFEYYFENELYKLNPYARHPDYFQSSVHLIPDVQNESYQKTIQDEAIKFNIDYRVVVLEKEDKACHGFSFGLAPHESCASSTYILSHLPVLQCFIKCFRENMEDLFDNLYKDQLPVDNFFGKEFYNKPPLLGREKVPDNKVQFLKQMGLLHDTDDLNLTRREVQCIRLLLRGYSAGESAKLLSLSKRTVEHYIENIKFKTNCYSKIDLFDKFHALNSLGLL